MFKIRKNFALKILLLFSVANMTLLSGCSDAISFKSDEKGNLIDSKNDRHYVLCSISLKAASTKADPYAKAEKNYKVYEIPLMSPAEWLSESIKEESMPFVYREENVPEPQLSDFEPLRIHVTQTELATLQVALIENIDTIRAIMDNIENGEECDVPSGESIGERYTFNFASETYPGLFYTLQYFYDNEGNIYLNDRGLQRCVIATEDYLNSKREADSDA